MQLYLVDFKTWRLGGFWIVRMISKMALDRKSVKDQTTSTAQLKTLYCFFILPSCHPSFVHRWLFRGCLQPRASLTLKERQSWPGSSKSSRYSWWSCPEWSAESNIPVRKISNKNPHTTVIRNTFSMLCFPSVTSMRCSWIYHIFNLIYKKPRKTYEQCLNV